MSISKKNREEARRRLQRAQPSRRGRGETTASVRASSVYPDIHREIRHITQLAQAGDSRIVTVGRLVLFSTRSRDAWLLDPEDAFAMCLCREGDPQPIRVIDAPRTIAIEWTAQFSIEGAEFIVEEQSGRVIVILGYPTAEIIAACRG